MKLKNKLLKMSLIFFNKINVCMIEKKNWIIIFFIWKNINKILNKKVDICVTFKTKHGLNKMHLLQFQIGWFIGKGTSFHY
jgi:hypothetical protein